MKKVFFLVAFFSLASMVSLSAQTPATVKQDLTAAVEAAKNDPSIIQKEGKDGLVTFSQKSVCSKSGKVSYKAVSYNAESKSWDKAASCSKAEAKSCAKKGKACCSKGAKSCDKKSDKACCSKGAKSCSGKKAKSCSGKKAKSCGSKKTKA